MFCIILQTIPLNHFTSNWIVSVDKKEWKQPNYFRENFQPFLLSFWYSALVKLRHSIPSKLHLSVCLPFLHIALLFSVFGKGSDNLSILLQKFLLLLRLVSVQGDMNQTESNDHQPHHKSRKSLYISVPRPLKYSM